jgi:uncharacterized protein YyaL (SSP411 family)
MSNARLAKASSPYLRQHADDPVEWHTWGPEAFAAARERDVPIFLSSGYSACHWCHVMQAESFQDAGTAALLNERFVPVKVDRELRPDVDAVYMDYVVATTGAGGWPMSVFLGPNLAPLAGGTYFPREARGSVPSFTEVLEAVDSAYRDDREGVLRTTEGALHFLREQAAPRVECELDRDALDRDVDYLLHLADQTRGGIGGAPKFPQATLTLFLCAYHALNPDPGVAWVVERTLTGMVRGGIYDQAGGGLHRYAVDTDWRTPHFEKMLYDQGLLLSCLAAGAPLASCEAVRGEYAYVAAQTAAFLRREMLAPAGGFFASLAADTLGLEGASYTWTFEQLAGFLSGPSLEAAERRLGVVPGAAEPSTLTRPDGRGDDADLVDTVLAAILEQRELRPRPEADTKLVTSWNAIAARGLMEAGAAFADEGMTSLGVSTLESLVERAVRPDGVLRVPDDPSVADLRLIEDHAHTVAAMIGAHDVTGEKRWLDEAALLHERTLKSFESDGVLYMTPAETDLPVRPREQSDEPTPSGASTAIENAVRLAEATGESHHREFAQRALRHFWAIGDAAPEHAGKALEAAARLARG